MVGFGNQRRVEEKEALDLVDIGKWDVAVLHSSAMLQGINCKKAKLKDKAVLDFTRNATLSTAFCRGKSTVQEFKGALNERNGNVLKV